MKICQHHVSIKKETIANYFAKLILACTVIKEKHKVDQSNLWLCLTCASIGCSRNSETQCAQKHYEKTKHKLTLSLKNGDIFCYQCDQNYSEMIAYNEQNVMSEQQAKRLEKITEFKESFQRYVLNLQKNKKQQSLKNKMDIEKQQDYHQINNEDIQNKNIPKLSQFPYKLNVFGLSNLGNTCFFNSTMQSLYATKVLYKAYLEMDFNKQNKDIEAIMKVEDMYSRLNQTDKKMEVKVKQNNYLINQRYRNFLIQSSRVNTFSPSQIFSSVGAVKSKFKSMAQQDAQQLLRYLIDAMNDGEISYLGINKQHLRLVELKFGKQKLTPLEKIFGCYLASRLYCLNCKKISWTMDLCMDLSIEITKGKPEYIEMPEGDQIPEEQIKEKGLFYPEKGKKVFSLFEAFFAPQTLTKYNYFSCEHCKASKAIKKLYIKDPPQALTIVIKRFTNGLTKNGAQVQFPSILDLHGVVLNKGDWVYELYAVVVHQGSVSGGHYIAYTKRNNDWYYFSDSHFKKTNWESVRSTQAYILFYERIQ